MFDLIWRYEPSGMFTARLAYKLVTGFFEPSPNTVDHKDDRWWKTQWKLAVLLKVQVFLFMAFRDFVAAL